MGRDEGGREEDVGRIGGWWRGEGGVRGREEDVERIGEWWRRGGGERETWKGGSGGGWNREKNLVGTEGKGVERGGRRTSQAGEEEEEERRYR